MDAIMRIVNLPLETENVMEQMCFDKNCEYNKKLLGILNSINRSGVLWAGCGKRREILDIFRSISLKGSIGVVNISQSEKTLDNEMEMIESICEMLPEDAQVFFDFSNQKNIPPNSFKYSILII